MNKITQANTVRGTAILGLLVLAGTLGWAQTVQPDRAVVPLTDPGRPAFVEASVMRGSITVRAYEGSEIIVEARIREKSLSGDEAGDAYADFRGVLAATPRPSRPAARRGEEEQEEKRRSTEGMKRLDVRSSGLEVTERDNRVEVQTQSWKYATDLVIQVPAQTSLTLRSTNDGEVVVEGVTGEVDVNNLNGAITVRNVSGSVILHSLNGDIEATLLKTTDKPMSFSNMNGDIDVTLPAATKADLKLKSQMGEIYSDFEVNLSQAPQKVAESGQTEKGRYRVAFEKTILGKINGGGPEITFNTFHGDIFIRKGK